MIVPHPLRTQESGVANGMMLLHAPHAAFDYPESLPLCREMTGDQVPIPLLFDPAASGRTSGVAVCSANPTLQPGGHQEQVPRLGPASCFGNLISEQTNRDGSVSKTHFSRHRIMSILDTTCRACAMHRKVRVMALRSEGQVTLVVEGNAIRIYSGHKLAPTVMIAGAPRYHHVATPQTYGVTHPVPSRNNSPLGIRSRNMVAC